MVCARDGQGVLLLATTIRDAYDIPVIAADEGFEAFQQPGWLMRPVRASTPDILTVPGLPGLTAARADHRRYTVLLLGVSPTRGRTVRILPSAL